MKRIWLLVVCILMFFGLGTGVYAFDFGSEDAWSFGPDDNRNVFYYADGSGFDHSCDEAIAEAFLNGETAPDYLLNVLPGYAAWHMKYVALTNPELTGLYTYNVWYNSDGIYTSAYVTYYTDEGHTDWQKAQAEYAARLADIIEDLEELIPEGATDAMIAHIVHDYLVANTAYDKDNADANSATEQDLHDAYGALVMHYSACQGYSMAYMQLMNHFGVNCVMATSGTAAHAWNLVELEEVKTDEEGQEYTEKNWYHVDLTSDDLPYDMLGRVDHEYLFLSTPELLAKDSRRADFIVYSRDYSLVFTDNLCASKSYEGRDDEPWTCSGTSCCYLENGEGGIDLYTLDGSNALHKNGGPAHLPYYEGTDGENHTEEMAWYLFGGFTPYQKPAARLCPDFSDGKHILYYSSPSRIYRIDLDDQEDWADDNDGDEDDEPRMTVFFTAPASEMYELIFGLARIDGTLYYTYSNTPAGQNEIWRDVEAELGEGSGTLPGEDSAPGTVYLSGGKSYADIRHTSETEVCGLSYDSGRGVWILNGVSFETAEAFGFYFEDSEVTLELCSESENSIVLNGENSGVKTGIFAAGALTVTGDGALSVSVSGGGRRVYGIRVLGDLCIRGGADVSAFAETDDGDQQSFGIFQWKESGAAEFFNCKLRAKGQRAAVRFGKNVLTKSADHSDVILLGSTVYAEESGTLTGCVFGSVKISEGLYEEVKVALQGESVVRDFSLQSDSSYAIARELDSEGQTVREYDNLPEAALVSSHGNRVVLLRDYSLSAALELPENACLNLDLSGFSLTDPGAGNGLDPMIINYGTLHISDSSEGDKGKISCYMTAIENHGVMSISDITVEAYVTALQNEAGAEFTMLSGAMQPMTVSSSRNTVINSGKFVMVSGTLQNKTTSVLINSGGEFIMRGGTVSGNQKTNYVGAVICKGSFTMLGGTISGNQYGLDVYTDEVSLLGGQITGNYYYGVKTFSGCNVLTVGGDISVKSNTMRNIYLCSDAANPTRFAVSTEVPLTEDACLGVKFTNTAAAAVLPNRFVTSGLEPEQRTVFRLEDSALSSVRVRFCDGGGLELTSDTTLTVHLRSDCGGNSVALLSGGGDYEKTAQATLTAPAVPGFIFDGWYADGALMSGEQTFTLTDITDDVFAVARYTPDDSAEFTLTPAAGDYEARVPGTDTVWSMAKDRRIYASPAAELTLLYTGSRRFFYWIDEDSGCILSCDPEWTFAIMRSGRIRAVTGSPAGSQEGS